MWCDFTPKTALLHFLALSLGTTYDDHLRLIGNSMVDFLLALIEPFSLGVTAEALQANISSKSAISLQRAPVETKSYVEVVPPPPTILRKLS